MKSIDAKSVFSKQKTFRVAPIGALSLFASSIQSEEKFLSTAKGLSTVYRALKLRVKRYGMGSNSDVTGLLCDLGFVIPLALQEKFDTEMRAQAAEIGGHFLAFYEAMSFEGAADDQDDDQDQDDEDAKAFHQAYRRLFQEVLKKWSVVQVMDFMSHTIKFLDAAEKSVKATPLHIARTDQFVSEISMPEEYRSYLEAILALGATSGLYRDPSQLARSMGKALDWVFVASLDGGQDTMTSRNTEGSALKFILSAYGLSHDDLSDRSLVEFFGQKGWLASKGFFSASYYYDWFQKLLASPHEKLWRAALQTPSGGVFCDELVEQSLTKKSTYSPISEYLNTPEDFNFLGRDLMLLKSALASSKKMKVLLVGPNGSGRRALVETLSRATNNTLLTTKKSDNHHHGQFSVFSSVNAAQAAGAILKDGVLMIPHLPSYDDKDIGMAIGVMEIGAQNMHEVWLSNDLESVHKLFLDKFDLVIQMPVMPIRARKEFAEKIIGPDLAEKVSQAATLPGEIISIMEWSNRMEVRDWNALSASLLGVQRARMTKESQAGDLPVQLYPPSSIEHGFEAVIGEDSNVKKAKELSDSLKRADEYERMGIKPPKGILLLGPPGCGKTHLARAIAKDAGVNLLLASAAGMAQKPETIHAVFNEARKQSPCILFIDEIDAVGASAGMVPTPDRQSILNRLLTELDGFEALDGVLVIGATHRGDLLDSAITRSGRMGHSVIFTLPEKAEREALWKYYTKNMPLAPNVNWNKVSRMCTGMSPADIAQAANSSGLCALREHAKEITTNHMLTAIEVILWGDYHDTMPIDADELWRVCVHEAGHAFMSWHNRIEIDRVCVRPRADALGFVRLLPKEGFHSMKQSEIAAHLGIAFGGAVAETVVLQTHGTGAESDLHRIRVMTTQAVRASGMHEKYPAGVPCFQNEKSPSEKMHEAAEEIEGKLIEEAHKQTRDFLSTNQKTLTDLADLLRQEREVDGLAVAEFLESRVKQNIPSGNLHQSLAIAARHIGLTK